MDGARVLGITYGDKGSGTASGSERWAQRLRESELCRVRSEIWFKPTQCGIKLLGNHVYH